MIMIVGIYYIREFFNTYNGRFHVHLDFRGGKSISHCDILMNLYVKLELQCCIFYFINV